jgi:hypothetical protein
MIPISLGSPLRISFTRPGPVTGKASIRLSHESKGRAAEIAPIPDTGGTSLAVTLTADEVAAIPHAGATATLVIDGADIDTVPLAYAWGGDPASAPAGGER